MRKWVDSGLSRDAFASLSGLGGTAPRIATPNGVRPLSGDERRRVAATLAGLLAALLLALGLLLGWPLSDASAATTTPSPAPTTTVTVTAPPSASAPIEVGGDAVDGILMGVGLLVFFSAVAVLSGWGRRA